jgi:CSLREA domain-containing protein
MRVAHLFIILAVFALDAFATDYAVTKIVDASDGVCDADCSLREALIAANGHPGADRVLLGAGLTYSLTLGPADAEGALTSTSGDLDIMDALTIEGNGSTVDAASLDRVFDIQGTFTVTVNSLTIKGGVARGFLSLGGGIYSHHANLVLNNCTVTGNSTALESGERDNGGGIAAVGSYNESAGTAAFATLVLNGTIVSGNTGLNGGGIVCVICQLTVAGGAVSSNTATGGDGGGMNMVGDISGLSVSGSTISGNSVSGGSARGGALSIPFGIGIASLSHSRITSNTGTTGSAIHVTNGTVTAINNWWGCNYGPSVGGTGCVGTTNGVSGAVTTSPHLVLQIAAPAQLTAGSASPITADLTFNSANADTTSGGYIPDGTTASFSGTLGTFATPSAPTANGKASDVYTAGASPGIASLSTTVDTQTVSTSVVIQAAPPATRRRSQTISI